MKYLLLVAVAVCLLVSITCSNSPGKATNHKTEAVADSLRNKKYATEALKYCKQKGFDTSCCILIDMSIHSGSNRLFVWNFKEQKSDMKGVVTHGCGKESWSGDGTKETPQFSNTPDSHLSSLGKYKIGERGYSQWGINIKYLLHGLESTNNNALKRTIVLHSWKAVPDEEISPDGAPESWGCPAVSDNFMRKLDVVLKDKKKPVLLWIYN